MGSDPSQTPTSFISNGPKGPRGEMVLCVVLLPGGGVGGRGVFALSQGPASSQVPVHQPFSPGLPQQNSGSASEGWGLRVFISNESSGDASVVVPQATLGMGKGWRPGDTHSPSEDWGSLIPSLVSPLKWRMGLSNYEPQYSSSSCWEISFLEPRTSIWGSEAVSSQALPQAGSLQHRAAWEGLRPAEGTRGATRTVWGFSQAKFSQSQKGLSTQWAHFSSLDPVRDRFPCSSYTAAGLSSHQDSSGYHQQISNHVGVYKYRDRYGTCVYMCIHEYRCSANICAHVWSISLIHAYNMFIDVLYKLNILYVSIHVCTHL